MRIHIDSELDVLAMLQEAVSIIAKMPGTQIENARGFVVLDAHIGVHPATDSLLIQVGNDRYAITARRLP